VKIVSIYAMYASAQAVRTYFSLIAAGVSGALVRGGRQTYLSLILIDLKELDLTVYQKSAGCASAEQVWALHRGVASMRVIAARLQ